MASGHTGNVVPRKGLRVRISCPPLCATCFSSTASVDDSTGAVVVSGAVAGRLLPEVLPGPPFSRFPLNNSSPIVSASATK